MYLSSKHGSLLLTKVFAICICLFFSTTSLAQESSKKDYKKLLDSAEVHAEDRPQLAKQYLDSIPTPVEGNLTDLLSQYYLIKGDLFDRENNRAKVYESYILALKHAEIHKQYDQAGEACIALASNLNLDEKNVKASEYLQKAKVFFTKSKNANGLMHVLQMPSYTKYSMYEYEASNALILEHLDSYRNFKTDGYFHTLALFMLVSNYLHLNEMQAAQRYHKEFEALKGNINLSDYLYNFYGSAINMCYVDYYSDLKQVDSTFNYLEKVNADREILDVNALTDLFKFYSETYKLAGNTKASEAYLDSLSNLQNIMLKSTVEASFDINNSLLQTEEELKVANQKKVLNRTLIGILLLVILVVLIVFIVGYKKLKIKLQELVMQLRNYSSLKSKHDKLKVQVLGLEDYIIELKKDIKNISNLEKVDDQRKRIKELYRNIQLKSSTVLSENENHFELINDLNAPFFTHLNTLYPQLDESDNILCYYLFIGFKNKEVASLLNRSVRSVESKRYRISKKIGLKDRGTPLLEHLHKVCKGYEPIHSSKIQPN